ncbi:MAG: hypothetical protein R3A79_21285 [Nannocystaceae bacterium]
MAVRNFERLMDLRTIHRNLASGLITKEDVAEFRRGLPDASEKFEVMTIPDEDDDDDDDDDLQIHNETPAPQVQAAPATPASLGNPGALGDPDAPTT